MGRFRSLRPLVENEAGGVALIFALALPAIAMIACGAIDMSAVYSTKSKLQTAVDAAALSGAKQLSIADAAGLQSRTEAYIAAQLGGEVSNFTYSVKTGVSGENGSEFTVTATANRMSFFANMLPPGGWNFGAAATAQRLNQQPLCVLTTGSEKKDQFEMRDQANISAPDCMVHSNGDIRVTNVAKLSAGTVEASGGSSGTVSPAAQTGAPLIEDPFASLSTNSSSSTKPSKGGPGGLLGPILPIGPGMPGDGCTPVDMLLSAGAKVLSPGVHCGPIDVANNATLTLLPGEHYFRQGKLELHDNAKIVGSDVVLIFDKGSDFKFKDKADIELEGRTSGQFSGFVIATTAENDHTFEISSAAARKLLGTIYIPSATLQVTGGKSAVANESAWTVIVAKAIKMQGAPNLVINANYAGSSVPVPTGVGPSDANVRLAK